MIPAIAPLQGPHLPAVAPDSSAAGDDAPVGASTFTVTPLDRVPDDGSLGFGSLLDALRAGGAQMDRAESAENAFAGGTGDLQEMVFERAKADSVVSVAAAAGSRVAQSLNTLAQMQL